MSPTIFSTTITVAAAASTLVLGRELARKGLAPAAFALRMLAPTIVCAFAGAKLLGFLDAWAVRGDEAWDYLLSPSGHSFYGLLIFGTPVLLFQARRARIPLAHFLDALAPAVLLGYAIGRIGCHLAGDGCYGVASDLPWAVAYPDGLVPTSERVHPTPLYESAAAALGFALLWRLRLRGLPAGALFALCLVLYGLERFAVEFLRRNPQYGPFSQAQWISFAAVGLGAFALARRIGRRHGARLRLAALLGAFGLSASCGSADSEHEVASGRDLRLQLPGLELEAEELRLAGKEAVVRGLRVRPSEEGPALRTSTAALFLDQDHDRRFQPPREIGIEKQWDIVDGRLEVDHWQMEVDGPWGEPTLRLSIRTSEGERALIVGE